MAPLTIYPNRRALFWIGLAAIPVGVFMVAGAALLFHVGRDGGARPIPPTSLFILVMCLLFGAFMLLGAMWAIGRARNPAPSMSIEDRGLRLLDRPPLSFARRPVFVPWSEVALLRFERGTHGARTLRVRTRSGPSHRIIASNLDRELTEIEEECLSRAHKAGLIGTSTKRDFFIVDHTEWRFTPA